MLVLEVFLSYFEEVEVNQQLLANHWYPLVFAKK
jgi:hypothetical protein